MYNVVLSIHSLVRWIALIVLIAAAARAWAGLLTNKGWAPLDRKLGAALIASIHTQITLGLLLYVALSPVTKAAFQDFGAAMKDPTLRFWAVEHGFIALIGGVAAHVAVIVARRAQEDKQRFMRAAIGYSFALLCILAAIPWPSRAVGRALLPF